MERAPGTEKILQSILFSCVTQVSSFCKMMDSSTALMCGRLLSEEHNLVLASDVSCSDAG